MKISLEGKNALIGGSTQGLGKAIALQLAACGANVTVVARNELKLQEVVKALSSDAPRNHQYLVADFSDFENFKKVIDGYFANNTVDILVNNTNGPAAGGALEKNTEDYQAAFNLLFQTYCYTTLAALPSMQKKKFGRIINVSSVSVKEPIQTLALSNSIRSAVIAWAKTLATDVAKDNITVNNILTGYFETERMTSLMDFQSKNQNRSLEEIRSSMLEQVPMKRFGKPEEYGYLVAFLASAYSAYITGTNIPIDGGRLKSI